METNGVNYRLGLDVGTNSVGWAAINLDDDGNPCGILDMGVRIFPDGRNPTDESSNAMQRRLARGQRRRRDRYLMRREDLINTLMECRLMPKDKSERKRMERTDPYELRAKALVDPLTPYELGRALFHLDQRRGFKSNRKAGGGDESEAKKTRLDIGELRRRIEESGARTLGEYLSRRRRKGKAVRFRNDMGLYPDRAMYEEEFNAICDAQIAHQDLSAEQWDKLREIIFFQRCLIPVVPGWCIFEDGKHRAPRALPSSQEFRMLQEVANLRLHVGTEPDRPLNDGEKVRLLKRLRSGSNLDLKKPVKALMLPSGCEFNLETGTRTIVKGDETAARLAAPPKPARQNKPAEPGMFGSAWFDLPLDERDRIVRFLLNTEEPELVRERAIAEWGLNEEQAIAVSNVSLVSGYGNLSEKAIARVLPHLNSGKGYHEAVQLEYEHHSDFRGEEALDDLPYYGEILQRSVIGADTSKDSEIDGEVARYGRIPNPTVHIGLNQLRRVVNMLIKFYGKPEEIVVELARDLKQNREQKHNYLRQQREGGERNNRLRADLEAAEEPVTQDMLRKLRLWDEQKDGARRICPYTGGTISFEMAVSPQTEVDHILPFSRTLDDSMTNKVVCFAAANSEKGNKTPYEAFGYNPPGYDYEQILANVATFPGNKRWRFQEDAMECFEGDNDFLARQLNETRYLSRIARTYLAHLYDEKTQGNQRVRAIPGRLSALLRRGWGLNGILSESGEAETIRKQRDDHRHHAIDAFIVANTTQGLLQKFASAAGSPEQNAAENLAKLTPPPWEGFHRNQVKRFLNDIVVSYKPDHGTRGAKADGATTGQLHKDTAYGLIDFVENGHSEVVVRKPISAISRKALDGIRDPELKAALIELWDKVGGNKAKFARCAEHEGVLVNGRHQRVRRVRVVEQQRIIPVRDGMDKPYKGYLPGSNEYADIWEMRDGSWQMVIVPTFHANQLDFDIENFRPKTVRGKHKGKPDPAAKRLMRIQIDDMGALGEGAKLRFVRVRKMSNSKSGALVWLDEHNEANVAARVGMKEMREEKFSAKQLKKQSFRKIHVDEIGRVRDPGP